MATIVVHRESGKRYIVIGAAYGMWVDRIDSAGGTFPTAEERGSASLLSLCNADGEIGWTKCEELRVESVDGKPPAAHLAKTGPYR